MVLFFRAWLSLLLVRRDLGPGGLCIVGDLFEVQGGCQEGGKGAERPMGNAVNMGSAERYGSGR
jgi:hypothetical protein